VALISVGLTHEGADLELLDRMTVLEHHWAKVVRALVSHRNISEAVFISTCLRTEVVAVADRFHDALDDIVATLSLVTEVDRTEFEDHVSVHFDRGVATYLFEVAAGLKSVVPGEHEVLGQLRRALDLAVDERTAGPQLQALVTHALSAGRRVRHETAIARGTTSFAHAAVETASDFLGTDEGVDVLVVGAGQLGAGVVKNVVADSRFSRVLVANRTRSRAESLREDVLDDRVEVVDFDDVDALAARARVTFICAELAEPVITLHSLGSSSEPRLLVDLAVPRGVERGANDLPGVTRVDLQTMRQRVDAALDDRRGALEDARVIVREEVDRYVDEQRARGASGVVSSLRGRFDDIVATEWERRRSDLEGLDEETRALVDSLVRGVVAKIAHRPTVVLKESAGTDPGARLADATRQLFDL
jgi:glutamyl-tRNA reductase